MTDNHIDKKKYPDLHYQYDALLMAAERQNRVFDKVLGAVLLALGAVLLLKGASSAFASLLLFVVFFAGQWAKSQLEKEQEPLYRAIWDEHHRRKTAENEAANQTKRERRLPTPEALDGGLLRVSIVNNEPKHPGLGITVAYSAPATKLTVYYYDFGLSDLSDGPLNSACSKHFEQCISDVYERATKEGWKAGELTRTVRGTETSGPEFLRVVFILEDPHGPSTSALLLTCWQGKFLKLRVTSRLAPQEAFDAIETAADSYSKLLWLNRNATWNRLSFSKYS